MRTSAIMIAKTITEVRTTKTRVVVEKGVVLAVAMPPPEAVQGPNRAPDPAPGPALMTNVEDPARALPAVQPEDPVQDQTVLIEAVEAARNELIGPLMIITLKMVIDFMWPIWTVMPVNGIWRSCLVSTGPSRRSGWLVAYLVLPLSFSDTARTRMRPSGKWTEPKFAVAGSG